MQTCFISTLFTNSLKKNTIHPKRSTVQCPSIKFGILRLYFSIFVEVSFLIFHSLLVSVPTGKTADSWCLWTERRKKFFPQTEEGRGSWTYIHDERLGVSPFSKSIYDKLCWFVIICCQGILGLTGWSVCCYSRWHSNAVMGLQALRDNMDTTLNLPVISDGQFTSITIISRVTWAGHVARIGNTTNIRNWSWKTLKKERRKEKKKERRKEFRGPQQKYVCEKNMDLINAVWGWAVF